MSTEVAEVIDIPVQTMAQPRTSTTALVLDPDSFNKILEVATVMAGGRSTIPKHLQGNPADCAAVIIQAMQWKMNPYAVAQKTHLVSGTLGYEGQLVNAVITSMAPTVDRINYEWYGPWEKVLGKFREGVSKKKVDEDTGEPAKYRVPGWSMEDEKGIGVRVWATMKGESEPRLLDLQLIQARTRNSPLWADDPRQQLAYLAVKRWARLHCPDVILGVYTPDELEEVPRKERDITPNARPADVGAAAIPQADNSDRTLSMIADLELVAKEQGVDAFKAEWVQLSVADKAAIGIPERNRIMSLARVPEPAVVDGEASHE